MTHQHRRLRPLRWLRGGAAVAGVLALALASACNGRVAEEAPAKNEAPPPSFGGPAVIELDLRGGLAETPDGGLFAPRRNTYAEVVDSLRELGASAETQGVFVRFGGRMGFARAHEMGRVLGEIRAKGKPIYCHSDDYDNTTYLTASLACSRIFVSPAGGVDTVGVAAQLLFAKSFLAKYKVDVDYLQIGKYKGAEEPFTRDAPSPEARSSLENALRGIRAAWLAAILKGRGDKVTEAAIEDGPYSPEEAKAKGFVDEVGYLDEAREAVKKAAGATRIRKRFGGQDGPPSLSRGIADLFRGMSGSGGAPRVAVLPASGAITMAGGGGLPLGGGDGITERGLGREIAHLTEDKATKAVVLRIDSPGGSALASDLLWSKLMTRRADKPLVVSVGGMAASGGYYLSCAGTKIVAEPTSIVGSIGVVGGKLSFGQALGEYGIHAETISASPDPEKAARSAYMSIFSPWDEKTRGRVRASMQSIYDLFVKRVAEGRGLPADKVATFAEGRLFAGEQAKDLGMVDAVGGLEDAIKLARELAKLPDDAPVDLVGTPPTFFEALAGDDSAGDSGEAAPVAAAEAARKAAADAVLAPWVAKVPELQAFSGALSPLFSGEKVLAIVPFAFVVR
jgi:protease-4